MNLLLAHKIISEVEAQPFGFLKVRGRELAREVQLMAMAGLVRASNTDELEPTEAIITRVTHAGHQFYHALKNRVGYGELSIDGSSFVNANPGIGGSPNLAH